MCRYIMSNSTLQLGAMITFFHSRVISHGVHSHHSCPNTITGLHTNSTSKDLKAGGREPFLSPSVTPARTDAKCGGLVGRSDGLIFGEPRGDGGSLQVADDLVQVPAHRKAPCGVAQAEHPAQTPVAPEVVACKKKGTRQGTHSSRSRNSLLEHSCTNRCKLRVRTV